MQPRLIVKQRITALVNQYSIHKAESDNSAGAMLGFAQQKRFNFKEKVHFYTDESKTNLAFTFRAEKVLDVHGKFLVEDTAGQLVGYFQKQFKSSLLNSTWKVFDSGNKELFTIRESSNILAAMRRFLVWIPYVGDLAEVILLFFRYHFIFIDPESNQEVAKYTKTTLLRDYYRLDMEDSAWDKSDWRLLAAACVALDALQGR